VCPYKIGLQTNCLAKGSFGVGKVAPLHHEDPEPVMRVRVTRISLQHRTVQRLRRSGVSLHLPDDAEGDLGLIIVRSELKRCLEFLNRLVEIGSIP
jgi:hypothetical protein